MLWRVFFYIIDLCLVPCDLSIDNLKIFLCLVLAENNSVEEILEVIFHFKIARISCWTVDVKPLNDLFSVNGVLKFCTNSHP